MGAASNRQFDLIYKGADLQPSGRGRKGNDLLGAGAREGILGVNDYDALFWCGRTVREPVGFHICRGGTWHHKDTRRSSWSDVLFHSDGSFQTDLRKIRREDGFGSLYEIQPCAVRGILLMHQSCSSSDGRNDWLCSLWIFGRHFVAGNFQQGSGSTQTWWHGTLCYACACR